MFAEQTSSGGYDLLPKTLRCAKMTLLAGGRPGLFPTAGAEFCEAIHEKYADTRLFQGLFFRQGGYNPTTDEIQSAETKPMRQNLINNHTMPVTFGYVCCAWAVALVKRIMC